MEAREAPEALETNNQKKLWNLRKLMKLITFKYWLPMGVLFIAFVSAGTMLLTQGAAAQLPWSWHPVDIFIEMLLAFARLCIGMSVAFLRIFMEIAAYNGYIDAPPVILGWYMVRDLANMFFVVALLVIAFGTILGLEQYEWKKTLVKLILAAVLINFSRLIIGVAIDASHIFTITFLNAVEGAAGGNLIGMLHLDKILSLVAPGSGDTEGVRISLLVAAMAGVIFALVSAIAIGAYLVVMSIRVVVLWTMIIVSPLVFILSAIPKTKSYADQFWQELTKYIIVAPTMVFFLWLAFATFGNGDINNHVGVKSGGIGSEDVARILDIPGASPAVSISEITTWENMSSFIIAIAFLFLGLVQVQKIGVVGGGVVGGALNFAKQAATIASGYAAGRFLVGAGTRGVKAGIGLGAKGVGLAAYKVTGLESRVKRGQTWAKTQKAALASRFKYNLPIKEQEVKLTGEEKAKGITKKQVEVQVIGKDGKMRTETRELAEGEKYLSVQKPQGVLQNIFHKRAVKEIADEKILEKTEKDLGINKEILSSLIQGAPEGVAFLPDDGTTDAWDRRKQGILKQLKARSAEKTKEHEAIGEREIGELGRLQFVTKSSTLAREGLKFGGLTQKQESQMGELAEHKLKAERRVTEKQAFEAEGKQAVSADMPELVNQINLAEQGKAAADAFLKRMKDADLKKQFTAAAEGIRAAARLETEEKRQVAFKQLSDQNAFVRALRASREQGNELEAMTTMKTQAEEEAEGEFVEKGIKGYTTPSKSMIAVAKRSAEDLNSLTNEALGKKLTDNLAFVAEQTGGGAKALDNTQMRAALFGTVNKVNTEAYIDDTIAEIAKQINRLEAGEITDEDEKKKLRVLQGVWEKRLGVIERDASGKAFGHSNERNAAMMQNYAITGGDVDMLEKHKKIEERMKNTGEDYGKAGQEALGADEWNRFKEKSEKNEVFMQEAAQSFKNQALAAGHRQLGGHQKFDSALGFHRMSTNTEHRGIMEAEMRKRGSKVGFQYHSLGDVNTGNGMLELVDADHYGNTVGQAKKYLEIKNIQDRTRDALMGYQPSEGPKSDNKGYGKLGGSAEDIKKHFGDVDNFIKQVLVPQLAKGATAFALVAQSKFANVGTQEAERGEVKVTIDRTGISANNLDELIKDVLGRVGKDLGADVKKQLEDAQKAALTLRTESGKKELPDEE